MVERKLGKPSLSDMMNKLVTPATPDAPKEIVEATETTKQRRCYVLTDLHIEKLTLLKAKVFRSKDLSEIICIGIDRLFESELGGEK